MIILKKESKHTQREDEKDIKILSSDEISHGVQVVLFEDPDTTGSDHLIAVSYGPGKVLVMDPNNPHGKLPYSEDEYETWLKEKGAL